MNSAAGPTPVRSRRSVWLPLAGTVAVACIAWAMGYFRIGLPLVVDGLEWRVAEAEATPPLDSGCATCGRGVMRSLDTPVYSRRAAALRVYFAGVACNNASTSFELLVSGFEDVPSPERFYVIEWQRRAAERALACSDLDPAAASWLRRSLGRE